MRPAALLAVAALSVSGNAPTPQYTEDGQLVLPERYREWVFLSSGMGMTYGPLGTGRRFPRMFDNVFVNPEAYRSFLDTGHWPDKTVFVLEVRYAASHGSINKDGHFQTDVSGVEALVRDEGRFEKKWGFFGFDTRGGQPSRSGRPIGPEAGCLACHTANGAVDGTFVQFYPTLLEVAREEGHPPLGLPAVHAFAGPPLPRDGERGLAGGREAARGRDEGRARTPHSSTRRRSTAWGTTSSARSKPALAVSLFEWIAAAHPESANAQDSLAEALLAAGEPVRARAAAGKALALVPGDASLNDRQRAAIEQANRKRIEAPAAP